MPGFEALFTNKQNIYKETFSYYSKDVLLFTVFS